MFILFNFIAAQAYYYATLIESNVTFKQYSLRPKEVKQLRVNVSTIQLEEELIFELIEHGSQIEIKIYDKAQKHFQLPTYEPFDYKNTDQNNSNCRIEINEINFNLKVIRNDEVIFQISNLIFSEHYIEFTHTPPSKYIIGLGERNQRGIRFREGYYTLMARDEPKLLEDGKRPGKHAYSSQPVLLQREQSGNFSLWYYKTASPMDVEYFENNMKLITIGGIVNIRLFMAETARQVIKDYHEYLGGWIIPPFWSTGFHQSRWKYNTSKDLIQVISQYHKFQIPIDVIWTDLDYMFDRQIFSVDFGNFTKSDYKQIFSTGTKYVPLIDVGVGTKYPEKDKGFQLGIQYDIFCYSPNTGKRFQGSVWPGTSYFPDWFHPNISVYWKEMINHLYDQVKFSGLWLDMNEPANFCNGECDLKSVSNDVENKSYVNPKFHLPYSNGDSLFENKTLRILYDQIKAPNLLHYGGILHKDSHNIYGIMSTYNTYLGQKDLGFKQTFTLSRSTFPGSGRYTQHWFGDNEATWDMLYLSLGQVMQFQIFGIPMTGADVCGFMEDTNDKLCARWIQLGSIYPFFRNHNNDLSIPQEFYALGDEVLKCAQNNVQLRYSLLKWMYMLYYREEKSGAIYNSLFFLFNDDQNTLLDEVMDTQVMIGFELMATPILNEGFIRHAYFPHGNWYDLLTGQKLEGGTNHSMYVAYNGYVPLYLRSGCLVIRQMNSKVQNSQQLNLRYKLIAALNEENESNGNFLDTKGWDLDSDTELAKLIDINMKIENSVVKIQMLTQDGYPPIHDIIIDEFHIYGKQLSEIQCSSCTTSNGNYLHNTVIIKEVRFGGMNKKKQIEL